MAKSHLFQNHPEFSDDSEDLIIIDSHVVQKDPEETGIIPLVVLW